MSDLIERLEAEIKRLPPNKLMRDQTTLVPLLNEAIAALREKDRRIEQMEAHHENQEITIQDMDERIAELEGLIEAYEASVNYPRPEDVDRIAELEAAMCNDPVYAELRRENKRLDAALADIRALCAQEGNDGEPWDTINKLAGGSDD